MQPEKLVMMANQIGRFFAPQGEERAVPQIADHINKFWDPRMRREILAYAKAGGQGLDPLVATALAAVKLPKTEAAKTA